jgi:hypothetical protein
MIHIWKKGGDFNEKGYMGILLQFFTNIKILWVKQNFPLNFFIQQHFIHCNGIFYNLATSKKIDNEKIKHFTKWIYYECLCHGIHSYECSSMICNELVPTS